MKRALALDAAATLLLAAVVGAFATQVAYSYPPPWPDEALFGDAAHSLLRDGILATPTAIGALPGADTHTYWMPPLYFIWLAGWFGVFGPSLRTMRAASLCSAVAVLFLTIRLARRMIAAPGVYTVVLLAATAVAVDPLFLRGSLIGRMDMLTLALSLAALLPVTAPALTTRALIVSGICGGLAMLTHPIGAAAPAGIGAWLCVRRGPDSSRARSLAIFAAACAVTVAPWLWYIGQAPSLFVDQFAVQIQRKFDRSPLVRWQLFLIFLGPPGPIQWLRVAAFGLGAAALAIAVRSRRFVAPALCTGAIAAGLVVWSGEEFYPLHLVPIAAIGIGCLATPQRARVAQIALAALILHGAGRGVSTVIKARDLDPVAFASSLEHIIVSRVPTGSVIFVLSNPDPMPLLMFEHRALRWRAFVPTHVAPSAFDAWLGPVDLFVIGQHSRHGQVYDWAMRHCVDWTTVSVAAGGYAAQVLIRPGLDATGDRQPFKR